VHDDAGRLLATGTIAWSAPPVALLAGIAADPRARGQGLGRNICAFLLAEALRDQDAVALMVENGITRHSACTGNSDCGTAPWPLPQYPAEVPGAPAAQNNHFCAHSATCYRPRIAAPNGGSRAPGADRRKSPSVI